MAADSQQDQQAAGNDSQQSTQSNVPNPHYKEFKEGDLIGIGALLILFSFAALFFIIALWPDRLPEGKNAGYYKNNLFHITLLSVSKDSAGNLTDTVKAAVKPDTAQKAADTTKKDTVKIDTTKKTAVAVQSTPGQQKLKQQKSGLTNAAGAKAGSAKKTPPGAKKTTGPAAAKPVTKLAAGIPENAVSFNTLLMLLVALAGFLGNMVSITITLPVFVANRKFDPSWSLWYVVKPFASAGLAVIVYFIFRAGFLSSSDQSNTINIYGLMALAGLTGMFSDIPMKKLRDLIEKMLSK